MPRKTRKRSRGIINKRKKKVRSRVRSRVRSKKNSLIKPNCAPNPNKTLDFTCYTNDGLYKLKELWNSRHPDVKIETNNPKEIWTKLRDYMSDTCSNEKCWLENGFIKNNLDKGRA